MLETESLNQIVNAVKRGERSAREIVRECLDRIDVLDGDLSSFRETYPDEAIAVAEAIDRRIASGEDPGPLAGVPIALKDNIVTDYGRTSCGSLMLESYRSPFTSTAVERLQQAGAIIIGKTNCDEFAMGSSTEHCAFAITRNPWDLSRVPGGSSGGSATAVTSGLCLAALGSDTGGSVRQPAAFCGVVGVKPSYGRVSRYGLVAFGSSLDQIGPITRNVADSAAILQVIAGADRRDSTCADIHVADYQERLDAPISDLRIGVPRQYLGDRNDQEVNRVINDAIGVFRDLGAEIIEIDLPLTEYGVATYYVIAPAEASGNLARFDGVRYGRRAEMNRDDNLHDLYARNRGEGFGPEVRRRIMLGTFVLSAGYYEDYYRRALQARRLIKEEFDSVFEQCHAIIGPTAPSPAFTIGEKQDALSMYLCDVYTAITNIAGHCAISIPAGFAGVDGRQLPVGLHIQCKSFDEETMFRIARLFEANTDHHLQRPPTAFSPTAS
ncbi:MAG: Asp-tRNA(Asn)/Glu-tRNA(Gln) amidotransferase subunit GatA [Planctomycetes bacterium]|nr:Asp-tRNA(Asn)/Glu-tRNA(Gln) amidotransferase subunit GatA [Planctomycetota bacterium]MCH7603170.1 Asp-tRNA(Asn)/Glu-tRNA(Gln) amidotransferase subunit GatA [Planctomycetota bacterium]